MIKMELVQPENLTEADIVWLFKGSVCAHDDATATDQVKAALNGNAGIFRISGDAQGIVVLQPGDNKTTTITCLAGQGFVKHFKDVHKAILATAAAAGATRVNGYATRAGLQALYLKHTRAKMVPMFVEGIYQ